MGRRLFLRSEVEDFKENQINTVRKLFLIELSIAVICWLIGGILSFITIILVLPIVISFFNYVFLINKDNDYWEYRYSQTWKNLSDRDKIKTAGRILGVLYKIFGS